MKTYRSEWWCVCIALARTCNGEATVSWLPFKVESMFSMYFPSEILLRFGWIEAGSCGRNERHYTLRSGWFGLCAGRAHTSTATYQFQGRIRLLGACQHCLWHRCNAVPYCSQSISGNQLCPVIASLQLVTFVFVCGAVRVPASCLLGTTRRNELIDVPLSYCHSWAAVSLHLRVNNNFGLKKRKVIKLMSLIIERKHR